MKIKKSKKVVKTKVVKDEKKINEDSLSKVSGGGNYNSSLSNTS